MIASSLKSLFAVALLLACRAAQDSYQRGAARAARARLPGGDRAAASRSLDSLAEDATPQVVRIDCASCSRTLRLLAGEARRRRERRLPSQLIEARPDSCLPCIWRASASRAAWRRRATIQDGRPRLYQEEVGETALQVERRMAAGRGLPRAIGEGARSRPQRTRRRRSGVPGPRRWQLRLPRGRVG
jgi:hypothetical protein